jgi:hypothetical protein
VNSSTISKTTSNDGESPPTATGNSDEKQKHVVDGDATSTHVHFPTVEEVMQMKVEELTNNILQHPPLTTIGTKTSLQLKLITANNQHNNTLLNKQFHQNGLFSTKCVTPIHRQWDKLQSMIQTVEEFRQERIKGT